MEAKLSSVSKTLKPSPIQQLSYLAERSNAINLTEGFPDFPAPTHIKAVVVSTITSDFNQHRDPPSWRLDAVKLSAKTKALVSNRNTDSAPAPFQEAALSALTSPPEYYKSLRKDYESKRNFVFKFLGDVGFQVQFMPMGAYFFNYMEELIKEAGVVVVPRCGFFHTSSENVNVGR